MISWGVITADLANGMQSVGGRSQQIEYAPTGKNVTVFLGYGLVTFCRKANMADDEIDADEYEEIDDETELKKMDWVYELIERGILAPINPDEAEHPFAQIQQMFGGWFDTNLETENVEEKAHQQVEKLESCTPKQLEAIATLMFLAIKVTLEVSGRTDQY